MISYLICQENIKNYLLQNHLPTITEETDYGTPYLNVFTLWCRNVLNVFFFCNPFPSKICVDRLISSEVNIFTKCHSIFGKEIFYMDMDFVCTFEQEYGRMVDCSRIICNLAGNKQKGVYAFDEHIFLEYL